MVTDLSWRKIWLASCLSVTLAMSLLLGLWKHPHRPAYTVLDLGLPGGAPCTAYGINASGLTVGTIINLGEPHACVYGHETLHPLGEPKSFGSTASSLNRHQQVVGAMYVDFEHQHAVLWQNGRMTDLSTLGDNDSVACAINDRGEVVGFTGRNWNHTHAFLYRAGQMQDLGTLGGARSQAQGINNLAQIVGFSRIDRTTNRAFLWQNGVMTDLGTLGGNNSDAFAINDQGTVIGTADTAEGERHAFRWQAGVMQDLGRLPGSDESTALALNNRGQIVGRAEIEAQHLSGFHAWLYTDGSLQDLNALIPLGSGWRLEEARGINDRGQIIGFGTFRGRERAFLLEPR
jgi:probable HAF family extracellular repeat protein